MKLLPTIKKSKLREGAERTTAELKHHYEVEKTLADKLLDSDRKERTEIYRNMYDKLFEEVPKHPRLQKRADSSKRKKNVRKQISFIEPYIDETTKLMEYGAGDCYFSIEVSKYVSQVLAVDISDQTGDINGFPDNFSLIIYDGYHLDIKDNSVDVVYSNQVIEHLHPEDIEWHFSMINDILKPEGKYIFTTPHRFTGPRDVSKYFSDQAEGFHLKEWTFHELREAVLKHDYSDIAMYWKVKGVSIRIPNQIMIFLEKVIQKLPPALRKFISWYLFPGITMVIEK